MPPQVVDNITTSSAVGAVTSPVWLPYLADVSQVAAQIAPILGVLWLMIQIWHKLTKE